MGTKMNYATLASLSSADQGTFFRIQDYLNTNVELFLNYKEFMAFFFIKSVFTQLSSASASMTTGT
jgi:hypothetical protein